MRRASVDLPHPDGPTITVSLPRSMVNEQSRTTSLRIWSAPYDLLTPSTVISPGTIAGRVAATVLIRGRSSRFQPRCRVAPEPAQELARRESRDADRDHADDDLLVRTADVRIPDKEAKAAAGTDRA